MGLVKVWHERKQVSPHRPKRARTGWLLAALVLVVLIILLLDRLA
jgi:hypothetical protein